MTPMEDVFVQRLQLREGLVSDTQQTLKPRGQQRSGECGKRAGGPDQRSSP